MGLVRRQFQFQRLNLRTPFFRRGAQFIELTSLLPGLTAVRCGGHFEGSSVLHWPAGAGGRGALFTGDTIMVAADRRWVSFLRSYPNYLPLPAVAVERIAAAVEPLAYDRIYGNPGWEKLIETGAKDAVARSVERYLAAVR